MSDARLSSLDTLRLSQSLSHNDAQSTPLDSQTNRPSTSKHESKTDHLGFLQVQSGTDPVVDIVAIHGLQGHREKTWTTEDGDLWLRDLLRTDIPNARVLLYGYDADTRSRECVSTQTMRRHAEKLAQALSRVRKDARRPIIFVAHDLGGIILKWALVICHNESLTSKSGLRDVVVSTHGILFFGTPHSGLENTNILEGINLFASVYMETTDNIIKDLRSNSAELENIQSLYVAASEKINSIFFYAEYVTSGIGNRGDLNVPYHSATISGDRNGTTIVLHANHRNMVRFSSKDEENYKTVHHHLKGYVDNAPLAVQEKWATEDRLRTVANEEYAPPEDILPKPRPSVSRSYIKREAVQSLITQKLLPGGQVQRQPRCILHGIGGSGKTQLATNWIGENEARFTRVIFVDASSQTQIEADLEQFIRSLGPEYRAMGWKDAIAYLDGKERGWLLFIDNADSPNLDLGPYLPASIHGFILITTRNSECISYAPDGAVAVGDLEENEAVNLLHKLANASPTSNTKSIEIVQELGMLALAITQAGVYIRKTRRLETYVNTFRKHRDELLRKQPDFGNEYTSSTYTAFDLSFHNLPAKTQDFLKICAFLHHSLIPISLFEHSIESSFTTYTVLNDFPPPESDKTFISTLQEILGTAWNEVAFQEIIDSASQASFINASNDGLFYTVHPLLQMYIKDYLNDEDNRHYARTATQLVLGAIRPLEDSNGRLWQLLPHASNIPRSVQSEDVAHALAFYKLYNSLGGWGACQELLKCALSKVQQCHGQRHKSSIWVMVTLGDMLEKCGQSEEAEKIEREVLALRLGILGQRHPDTISAMANLANTLNQRGQLDEAEKIMREVLALRLDILGQRHPDTISAMGNLANTLSDRGQLDEAEKMMREVLALQLDILGKRHPDTISAMANLAVTLSDLGQLDEAEKMMREVLALQLDILGKRHPDTISAMSNLAVTLNQRGQLDEAEKMRREVLALRLDILGQRHPHTISAMANLAVSLYNRGQLDEAGKIEQDVLALRLETLGPRHPTTLNASYNLSITLCKNNQLKEAAMLLQETMELRVEVLGADHRCTVDSKELLESIISQQSRPSRGRFQRLLSLCCICTEHST